MRRLATFLSVFALLPILVCCTSQPSSPVNLTSRTITETITIQTPTPGWKLGPVAAYRVGSEHWCIHQLTSPDGMAAQMISETSGSISFVEDQSGVKEVKHFVLGKTWRWNANPEITFIDSINEIYGTITNATQLELK